MSPIQKIRFLQAQNAELERVVSILKAELYASGLKPKGFPTEIGKKLTSQQQSMVSVLYARYPRAVERWDLHEALPGYDHVEQRDEKIVDVQVCKVRKVLGKDTIQTVHGRGYALSEVGYNMLKEAERNEAEMLAEAMAA